MATPAAILSILVRADTRQASSALSKTQGALKATDRAASGMGTSVDKGAKRTGRSLSALHTGMAALGGVAVFEGLRRGVGAMFSEFDEARKVGAQTDAVLRSTGGAANVTAKDVGNLAGAISRKVAVDDEMIQRGANMLLTFKNVQNEAGKNADIFNQATQAAVDLSAAGFGSITSTSKQLGKALNDPVKGLTALGRAGVTFSEEQKTAIKALMDTGRETDRVRAQQIILREVQSQVGGSAAAQATTTDRLRVMLGNLAEMAGSVVVPALEKVAGVALSVGNAIRVATGWLRGHKTATDVLVIALGALAAGFVALKVAQVASIALDAYKASTIGAAFATGGLTGALGALRLALMAHPIMLIVTALAALAAALVMAYKRSETFRNIVNGAFNSIRTVAAAVFGWLRGAVRDIAGFLTRMWQAIRTVLAAYWAGYRAIIINPIRSAFSWVKGAARDVAGFLARIWETIKTGVATYWRGYRALIIDPIRSAISWVKDRIGGLVGWLAGRWDAIRSGLRSFGASVRNMLADAFRGAANTVIGFVNAIIGAINKIPGVPNIDKIRKIGENIVNANTRAYRGQGNLGGTGHMAQGGAFARTGGLINKPMVMMGEEAPRYAEYVVPTNPAYRGRAKELLAQAASAIGMQAGGVWSKGALAKLWQRVNPGLGDPNLMAAIALAESGGRAAARNPSGAAGLWQILGLPFRGNPFDPETNARMAGWKLRHQGLGAWEASRAKWGGGGGGILGTIGGVLGKVGGALGNLMEQGADFILDKLPNPADMLPDWLVGTGKWAIAKVAEWVKNRVADILPGGGGGPLGDLGGALGGLMDVARRMGLAITSTTSGGHVKGSLHYQGRAFDAAGDPGAMMAFARQMASGYGRNLAELFFDPLGWSVKNGRRVGWTVGGHTDHVHVAMRKGGIFGGAFAEGGIVPGPVGAARVILAHAGELVVPMQKGSKYQQPRGGVGRLQKVTSRGPKKTKPTKGEKAIAQARASVPPFVFRQLNREIGRLQYRIDLLSARGVGEGDPRLESLETQLAFILRRRAGFSKQLGRTADYRRDIVESTRLAQLPQPADTGIGEGGGEEDPAAAELIRLQEEANEIARQAAEEAKRREEERNSLLREQNQNQRRLLAVAEGEPARMLAALVAAVNGDIGGRVGLGFASPSYAGRMARY